MEKPGDNYCKAIFDWGEGWLFNALECLSARWAASAACLAVRSNAGFWALKYSRYMALLWQEWDVARDLGWDRLAGACRS